MKRYSILLFVIASVATGCFASPVSKERALKFANNFLSSKNIGRTLQLTLVENTPTTKRLAKAQSVDAASYYVFNNVGGGFIIISGDDSTEPVLGYSDDGFFDPEQMPDNMKAFLERYEAEVEFARANRLPSAEAWDGYIEASHVIAPLVPATWGQDDPFSQKCFTTSGNISATGCVATAMAQIMYTYKWPQQQTGEIPAYSSYEALPPTVFQWSKMIDYYSGSEADGQKDAVADLMLYCGHSVQMSYYGSSAGAETYKSALALRDYFGYSSDINLINRVCFTPTEWHNMIYNELACRRPVIMGGYSAFGGHAFICDGYDGHGLFHFNWGWYGRHNGYYRMQAIPDYSFNPDYGGFTSRLTAIVGISPNAVVHPFTEVVPVLKGRIVGFEFRGSTTEIDYNPKNNFSGLSQLKVDFCSPTLDWYSFGLAIYDSEGNRLPNQLKGVTSYNPPGGYTYTTTSSLTGFGKGLTDGTYQIRPVSRAYDSDEWLDCIDNERIYIKVVIANGRASFSIVNNDAAGIEVTDVEKKNGTIKMTFTNNGSSYFQDVIRVSNGNSLYYTETLCLPPGESEYMEMTGSYSSDDTLKVVATTSGTVIYEKPFADIPEVEQNSATTLSLLNADIRNIDTQKMEMYGTTFYGILTLKNENETDFDGNIELTIHRLIEQTTTENGGTSVRSTWDDYEYKVHIPAGDTKKVEVSCPSLALGDEIWYDLSVGDNSISGGSVFRRYKLTNGYILWDSEGYHDSKAAESSVVVPEGYVAASFSGTGVKSVTPNKNPNTIYYFGYNDNVPKSLNGHNVVKGAKANGNVSFIDGKNMFVPIGFEVEGKVSYQRTFSEGGDGRNGWSTITLPFSVQNVTADGGKSVDWFHKTVDGKKDFWLKEFARSKDNEVVFENVETWRPNTPYLISVPNDKWGSEYSLKGKTLTFTASATKVEPINVCATVNDQLEFIGTTNEITVGKAYVMNSAGNAFDLANSAKVNPARAYFIPYSGLDRQFQHLPINATLQLGDVNCDGNISLADVMMVVDYVLGTRSADFFPFHADIYDDNSISLVDIVRIVNVVLEQ